MTHIPSKTDNIIYQIDECRFLFYSKADKCYFPTYKLTTAHQHHHHRRQRHRHRHMVALTRI